MSPDFLCAEYAGRFDLPSLVGRNAAVFENLLFLWEAAEKYMTVVHFWPLRVEVEHFVLDGGGAKYAVLPGRTAESRCQLAFAQD